MLNWFFVAAATASYATFAVHTFVGGPAIAEPLLAAKDIRTIPKYTNYYCWHLTTLTLFAMGCAFAWAAIFPAGIELAWFAFLLSTSFLIWGVTLILQTRQKFAHFPQWLMFTTISALAVPGLF